MNVAATAGTPITLNAVFTPKDGNLVSVRAYSITPMASYLDEGLNTGSVVSRSISVTPAVVGTTVVTVVGRVDSNDTCIVNVNINAVPPPPPTCSVTSPASLPDLIIGNSPATWAFVALPVGFGATITNMSIVADTANIVLLNPTSVANSTTLTTTATALVTMKNNLGITVTPTVTSFGRTATCPKTFPVNVVRPDTTVEVNAYSVPVGSCASPVGIFNASVTLSSTVYNSTKETDLIGQYVFKKVLGGNIFYLVKMKDIPNYTYKATCSNLNLPVTVVGTAQTRNYMIPNGPILPTYVHNFYFTQQALPWYQIVGGDGGANNGDISANLPFGEFVTMADGTKSEGALIAKGAVDAGLVKWSVNGSSYVRPPNDDYGYFKRLFGLSENPSDMGIGVLSNIVELDSATIAKDMNDPPSGLDLVYFHEGALKVNGLRINAGPKRTLFVHGSVTITDDVIVTSPQFFSIVASGDITFNGAVTQAEGVYISDGIITIPGSGSGGDRRFVGSGIFVGWGGVTLSRDLKTVADSLANNINPAERFIYRPDFLINASQGFLKSGIEWQEVAPGN